jgi:predicted DNA-binding transcriptional regulator AlpA
MRRINERALVDFDELPEAGYVRLPVVATLFGVSHSTVWRWSRKGPLPRPTKINGVTLWPVSGVRNVLAAGSAKKD